MKKFIAKPAAGISLATTPSAAGTQVNCKNTFFPVGLVFAGLIINALGQPAVVQFSSASFSASENDGRVVVSVVRGGDLSAGVTVDYATTNGTASAGLDYLYPN